MQIKIEFSCDNAAFEDDFRAEVGRVLEQARRSLFPYQKNALDFRLCEPGGSVPLLDSNGNAVGSITIME